MRIVVRKGGAVVAAVEIGDEVLYLGRSKKNQIILNDSNVSRRHAKIYTQGNDTLLEDLKSVNGTYYQGKRIERIEVSEGDVIKIPPFSLSVEETSVGAGTEPTIVAPTPPEPSSEKKDDFLDEIAVRPKTSDVPPNESGLPVLQNFLEETSEPEATTPESEEGQSAADLLPVQNNARLVRVDGEHRGEEHRLEEPSLSIGTADDCDLVIKEPGVSEHHATIEKTDNAHVLKDAAESTGTFIDGVPVRERGLESHDIVHVGSAKFEYVEGTARSRAQRPRVIERSTRVTKAPLWTVVTHRGKRFFSADWKIMAALGIFLGLIGAVLLADRPPTPAKKRPTVATKDETETDRVLRHHLSRAQALITQSKYDKAEARLNLVLGSLSPGHPDATQLMDEIKAHRRREQRQAEEKKRKEEEHADKIKSILARGDDERDAKRYRQARVAYEEALLLDKGNRLALGRLEELKELEETERRIELAKKKSDRELQELYTQGVIKFDAGDLGGAQNLLNQVAARKGHRYQASAQKLIDEIHRASDSRIEKQIKEIQLLIESNELMEARHDLEEVVRQFPRQEEAAALLKDVVARLESAAKQVYSEGIAYEELAEDREAAIEKYEQTLRYVPDPKHPYHRKAKRKLEQLGADSPSAP